MTFTGLPKEPYCIRCGREEVILADAPCTEKPETISGPIGMYHCLDCGEMLLAGFPHPQFCEECCTELAGETT